MMRLLWLMLVLLVNTQVIAEPGPMPLALAEKFRQMKVKSSEPVAAPSFTVSLLSGQQTSLDDYRGRWLVLNFWATYCAPCRVEMPSLDRFRQHYQTQPVSVLAVAMDDDRDAAVQRMASTLSPEFPLAIADAAMIASYHVSALPATFLINPEGRVVGQLLGDRNWDSPQALELMDALLGRSY